MSLSLGEEGRGDERQNSEQLLAQERALAALP